MARDFEQLRLEWMARTRGQDPEAAVDRWVERQGPRIEQFRRLVSRARTGGNATVDPLFTGGRIVGGAAVLAAVNVVLLTLLATLGALLYNVCASFTGGLELSFGERD